MLVNHSILNMKALSSDNFQFVHKTFLARQLRPKNIIIEDFFREQEKQHRIRRLETIFHKANGQHTENVAAIYYRQLRRPEGDTHNVSDAADHHASELCTYATIYPEYNGRSEVINSSISEVRRTPDSGQDVREESAVQYEAERKSWWKRFFSSD